MNSVKLLLRYLKFLKVYQPIVVTTIILIVVWTVINLVPPWLIKILIDDALPRQDVWLLCVIVIAQTFIAFNGQFMRSLKGFLVTYVEQRINLDLHLHLFDHLMTLPITFFNKNQAGEIAHRFMDDITQIRQLISTVITNIVVNVIILIMLVTILFFINVHLAFTCLLIAFIYGLNANIFKNRIYGAARDMGERTSDLYSLHYQIMPGIREIKGLQITKYVRRLYSKGVIKYFRASMKNFQLSVFVSLIADILPHIAWAVVIGFGGFKVITGVLTVGSLLAFANYLDRIYTPITELSGIYSELQRAVPAMERVAKILDQDPEFNTFRGKRLKLSDVKGRIQLKSVGFGYIKGNPVIKHIDMNIEPNTKIAIVGESGCGKTTIAHLLMRFFDVSSGSIYLDGANIKQINIASYRKNVGLVPQGVKLFAASIKENIMMGNRRASFDEVVEAAKIANAHDFIERLPDGYDTLYGEKGVWLSGGESQRIVIARAVLQNPKVLILDEATSSVDANSEAMIQDAINKAAVGKTLIVIAHRFSTIIDADVIYVIDNGSIIAQGDHEHLVENCKLYSDLYQKQVKKREEV